MPTAAEPEAQVALLWLATEEGIKQRPNALTTVTEWLQDEYDCSTCLS
jgi:hypothetical protein